MGVARRRFVRRRKLYISYIRSYMHRMQQHAKQRQPRPAATTVAAAAPVAASTASDAFPPHQYDVNDWSWLEGKPVRAIIASNEGNPPVDENSPPRQRAKKHVTFSPEQTWKASVSRARCAMA